MEERIRNSFARQGLMKTLGADIVSIERGKVVLQCTYHPALSQQHGFFHAGVLTSLVDSACGYAAYTTMAEDSEVLSVEFKINFMKPADCKKIIATGLVTQAGQTLVICEGIVTDEFRERVFAKMMATMISVRQ